MHLFEFMDLDRLPKSLRDTLRDILRIGNSQPFRPYYQWVAKNITQKARELNCHTVVELGAGPAPITEHLLSHSEAQGLNFVVCDINPDQEAYRELEKSSQGRVKPIYEPVDFSKPRQWGDGVLLVLSATLHHIPTQHRSSVLTAMLANKNDTLIFEPLRRTWSSVLFTFGSMVPALVAPIWFLNRPGRLRRFLWCWAMPAAPLMFVWDGIASCVRMWDQSQWTEFSAERYDMTYLDTQFCQFVTLSGIDQSPEIDQSEDSGIRSESSLVIGPASTLNPIVSSQIETP